MLDKTAAFFEYLDSSGGDCISLESYSALMGLMYAAKSEVDQLRTLPQVVCLCGSSRFMETFHNANRDFTLRGKIVLGPGYYGHDAGTAHTISDDEKAMLDALHFRKIDLSSMIYVINIDGYIGDSTHNEIVYAVKNDKLVQFLEDVVLTKRGDKISTRHYLASIKEVANG